MHRRTGCLVVGLLLAVSACSHSSPAAPAGSTGAVPQAISKVKGHHVAATAFAQRVAAAVALAHTARFTVASSLLGTSVAKGALLVDGADTGLSISTTTAGTALRAVILPGSFYLDPGQPQGGKHWIKLGSVTGGVTAKVLAPLISRVASAADVSSLTQGWAGAGQVTVGPTLRISGVKTVEYDAVIPRSAVLTGISQELQSVIGATVSDTRARIWLDAKGRPIRITTSSTLDGSKLAVTVNYTDWGHGPVVHAPAASDVRSLLPGL
jgi:hypothetical protein